ncbi:UNVERIFIED_CONTAM: hypothetical protein FKN15_052872 [Acipenser sinensis]
MRYYSYRLASRPAAWIRWVSARRSFDANLPNVANCVNSAGNNVTRSRSYGLQRLHSFVKKGGAFTGISADKLCRRGSAHDVTAV